MTRTGLMAGVLVVLMGCSTTMPETRYYLLSDPNLLPTPDARQCSIRLGQLSVAPYLKRDHLLVQTTATELVPANYHRWSEPLSAGASRLLSRCLGDGAARNTVDIEIQHLHGSVDGALVLDAVYVLGEARSRSTARIELEGAGYPALVQAHREALLALCSDIHRAHRCDAE